MLSPIFRLIIVLLGTICIAGAQDPPQLLAAAAGEVYRSTDGGASWQAARIHGELPFDLAGMLTGIESYLANALPAIVTDPADPRNAYAAAALPVAGLLKSGVFRSEDGGATWKLGENLLTGQMPTHLLIDPRSPRTLYAALLGAYPATLLGLFKSTDGGGAWSRAGLATMVTALAMDPSDSATIYVATVEGIFKSADAAATWSAACQFLAPGGTACPMELMTTRALAIDPGNSATLYAAAQGAMCLSEANQAYDCGVFKSVDGGRTWRNTPAEGSVLAIAIDPQTPSTVYAAGSKAPFGGHILKSADGGGSWSAVNKGLACQEVTTLALDPSTPSTLYAGCRGETLLFKSTDGGASWSPSAAGIRGGMATALSVAAR